MHITKIHNLFYYLLLSNPEIVLKKILEFFNKNQRTVRTVFMINL